MFCCIVFVASGLRSVSASENGLSEVSPAEKQAIAEKFFSQHKDITSLRAVVSQEKHLALMKKTVFVEGSVEMAKPNLLRWETLKPDRSITVIDGRTMTVYYPESKEAQVYALSENFIARNTANFFATAMSGALPELEKKFTVSVFRGEDDIVFRLIPISSIAGRYLTAVVIHYDKSSGIPKGIEMTTPRGDKTITRLTEVKTNPGLDAETFKIKLPSDVRITNLEK